MAGLFGPFCAALIMIFASKNEALRKDLLSRVRFCTIKPKFLAVIALLMPFTVFLATGLSLLFGYSAEQVAFSREIHLLKGHGLVGLLVVFMAPVFEELGWRGYGVDSLRSYLDLFRTTILFAVLWSTWHMPLFFIDGYYHHELWNTSMFCVVNFFLSVVPGAALMNWIYYKNDRSIIAAILFHFMMNLSAILFQTEQFTKCLVTMLMVMFSVGVFVKDRQFFFTKQAVGLP
jgi:uncharacterized protein